MESMNDTIFVEEIWKEKLNTKQGSWNQRQVVIFQDQNLPIVDQQDMTHTWIVNQANSFGLLNDRTIEMDMEKEEDYIQLSLLLKKQNIEIDVIVHCMNRDDECKAIDDKLNRSGLSQLYIMKHLIQQHPMQLVYIYENNRRWCYLDSAMEGFFNVSEHENAQVQTHLIEVEPNQKISMELIRNEVESQDRFVKYEQGCRYVRTIQEVKVSQYDTSQTFHQKTYVVFGGVGGVGTILITDLLEKQADNVIVCGRRGLYDEKVQTFLKRMNLVGKGRVEYVPCDCSNLDEINRLSEWIERHRKKVDGIYHLAGTIQDAMIKNKKKEEFLHVLTPKVKSIDCLTQLAQRFDVEEIIYFSSISSIVGTIGQVDYAYANSALNHLAMTEQTNQVSIYSIAWPLWDSEGMAADERVLSGMRKQGFDLLTASEGIKALHRIRKKKAGAYFVFHGDQKRMRNILGLEAKVIEGMDMKKEDVLVTTEKKEDLIKNEINEFVKRAIVKTTRHNLADVGDYDEFDALGIDSVKMIDIIETIEEKVGSLSKTLFFEYQTINQLVDYLYENYESKFTVVESKPVVEEQKPVEDEQNQVVEYDLDIRLMDVEDSNENSVEAVGEKEPIAIVGMDGKFPQADNLQEFWDNLVAGSDCIVEIPKERWDYHESYEKNSKKIGKVNSKWGGFVNHFDEFDAEFFKYSPIEAALIDPQERLFMESTWNAMEHAGYTRTSLKNEKVGVFVGVSWGHYQAKSANYDGNELMAVSSFSSIANRVSYFYDLTGPSMAIDTMCSSSGTAIHLACESLWRGETSLAFAGGVNLTIDETKYKVLSTKNYLSSDGKCRSFGEGGDGYVPGEGVGCILLKPLSQAVKDGNHIEAVILSTGVNHGGKSTGYSVPNPKAQAELIEDTIRRSDVSPEEISYIETHGTGTPLGDPIEIVGLSRGLHIEEHPEKQYMIGSVKSNIGHLESAAAVAALLKVVLQMKHNQIVPSIHSKVLNKQIDFDHLPFTVCQDNMKWEPETLHTPYDLTLCSGVSSFGAGGSNAFLLVGAMKQQPDQRHFNRKENVVILSAMNQAALESNIKRLYDHIATMNPLDEAKFTDLCYTLQIGREAMPVRMAFIVSSMRDLTLQLSNYLTENEDENRFAGTVHKENEGRDVNMNLNLSQIAKAWVDGYRVDWIQLYKEEMDRPRFIALPTYSFQRKRYWIDDYNQDSEGLSKREVRHSMIDYNYSTMERQLYSKKLTGNEPYFADHIINEQKIMPGASYLELARTAADMALKGIGTITALKNVVFERALTEEEAKQEMFVEFYQNRNRLEFEVKTEAQNELIYCTGDVLYSKEKPNQVTNRLDHELFAKAQKQVNKEEVYNLLQEGGFQYKRFFQTIQQLYIDTDVVYAKLAIDNTVEKENQSYVLKPSILDGALQTIAVFFHDPNSGSKYLPYKIGQVDLYQELTSTCYVVTKKVDFDGRKFVFNIEIYNDQDELAVRISGYTVVMIAGVRKEEVKSVVTTVSSDKVIREKVKNFVIEVLSKETGTPVKDIQESDVFEKYGIDSVISMRITDRLKDVFEELPTTLLYEFKDIATLVNYLVTEKREDAVAHFSQTVTEQVKHAPSEEKNQEVHQSVAERARNRKKKTSNRMQEDIAIIGIDGRYPQSDDMKAFWENLVHGVDCVTEVPIERWDYRTLYSPDKNAKGKIYSKWGGFINGAEEFDSEFFGIVPLQAIIMDPQERIYLETAWHCVEDAGYSLKELEKYNVGVYTGEMWGDYQKIGVEETMMDNTVSFSSSYASTSNKVSYIMNLHGPSMTVDTMCSSSLTSIHLACKALNEGSIDMALAGGVNLTLHPDKYISLCQGKFLSSEGKCRSFGEGGDGYVPGEGVGVVLLKRLSDAERDQDHIYAVIKATSINHGGKSNAYFVPNVEEQSNLIVQALNEADISPRTISSVEAHGTGTALGDPIEVAGFSKAYGLYTNQYKYCSLGSVKSNIGHCESAAGIAAVSKVLLEMKYKKLVPSIHSQVLNQKIDFEHSPFYVQHEYEDWKKPVLIEDGVEVTYPRRAAISAFGAGGTNVHVIMEEYEQDVDDREMSKKDRLFVFSAKKKSQLNDLLVQYQSYLEPLTWNDDNTENRFLADLAGTLLTGRESFQYRLAIIADSVAGLVQTIKDYLDQKSNEKLYVDQVNLSSFENEIFNDEEGQIYLHSLIERENLSTLAKLWTKGVKVECSKLKERESRKVSLPVYPFEKNLIKVDRSEHKYHNIVSLHTMIDRNVSTIQSQMFEKELKGNEFYLADHLIGGNNLLPGVAYLEMVRAAAQLSVRESTVSKIKDIYWKKPLIVGTEPVRVAVSLKPNVDHIDCTVETVNNMGIHNVYSSSKVELVKENPNWFSTESIDLQPYNEKCKNLVDKTDFYNRFKEIGFVYGDRMQGIGQLFVSDDQQLAKVVIVDEANLVELNEFTLHPAILDAGVQAVATLIDDSEHAYLPYSIKEIEIIGDVSGAKNIVINKLQKVDDLVTFDLIYVDEAGKVLAKMNQLAVKQQVQEQKQNDIHYYTTKIVEQTNQEQGLNPADVLVIMDDEQLWKILKVQYPSAILVLHNDSFEKVKHDFYYCNFSDEQSVVNLFTEIKSVGKLGAVVYKSKKMKDLSPDLNYGVDMFLFTKAIALAGIRNDVQVINVFDGEITSKDHIIVNPSFLACAGLYKTISMESNHMKCKNIGVDASIYEDSNRFANVVQKELSVQGENVEEIFICRDGSRMARVMDEITASIVDKQVPIHEKGVYIISGGLKGLGYIFAQHIAKKYHGSVALLGRSKLDEDGEKKLKELRQYGVTAEYYSVDVTDYEQVFNCSNQIRRECGAIRGIIHSAGVKKDEIAINKSKVTFRNTIKTKVEGIDNLCQATNEDVLDFVVAFSSIAGLMGNVGQVDYAYANNYMDAYSFVSGQQGRNIITINWPYWLNGGMQLRESDINNMKNRNGMLPLETSDGIHAFEQAIARCNEYSHMLVLSLVDQEEQNKAAKQHSQKTAQKAVSKTKTITKSVRKPSSKESMMKQAEAYIKEIISDETKIALDKLDRNESFDSYGFDSVMTMNMSARIDANFADIPKSLFYETHNIAEMAEYLYENYEDDFTEMFGGMEEVEEIEVEDTESIVVAEREPITFEENKATEKVATPVHEDMAIVAIRVKGPNTKDLEELWENIIHARNCIGEVPTSRFDCNKYYSENPGEIGKTYCKLGGFMDGIDEFDPQFFNIAPRNATFIDPMERLLLQEVWHLFEDSGNRVSQLKKRDVGVFIGAMWQQYQMLLMNGPAQGMVPSLFSNLSNRISSYFDLHGPSLTLDTMCSSSLTALHLAMNSIRNQECSSAIVGGINLSLHESKYINLSQGGLVSKGERCIPFGQGADGYLPSEGLGLVMVKPLSEAKKDKDTILLVIKSSAIMHSGKGSGFMTPNSTIQKEVILKAMEQQDIPADSIGYIEAQGICTEVGDVIEFNAMNEAYKSVTNQTNFCALGSAKYCIGHTEAASGILALAKIAMQMKHHMIPGILLEEEINQGLKLEQSPFFIPQKNLEWKSKEVDGKIVPLRAALNGFGGAGAYVHFILEEYVDEVMDDTTDENKENAYVLSAKSQESLDQMVKNLSDYLQKNQVHVGQEINEFINPDQLIAIIASVSGVNEGLVDEDTLLSEMNLTQKEFIQILDECHKKYGCNMTFEEAIKVQTVGAFIEQLMKHTSKVESQVTTSNVRLDCLAYTLQVARESFANKIAFIASSANELVNGLEQYKDQSTHTSIIYGGNKTTIENATLAKLVEQWLANENVDWDTMYQGSVPKKLVIPVYPFKKETYWIPKEWIVGCDRIMKPDTTEVRQDNEPVSNSKERVTAIIAEALGIEEKQIDSHTDLREYGLDSFIAQKVFLEIATITDTPLTFSMFDDVITVDSICDAAFHEFDPIEKVEVDDQPIQDPIATVEETNDEFQKLMLMQLANGDLSVEDVIKMEAEHGQKRDI